MFRGLLLDLLATGDRDRVQDAVERASSLASNDHHARTADKDIISDENWPSPGTSIGPDQASWEYWLGVHQVIRGDLRTHLSAVSS